MTSGTPRVNTLLPNDFRTATYDGSVRLVSCSRDPIGYAGGINLSGYVGNAPSLATDPLGLCDSGVDDYVTPHERKRNTGPPKRIGGGKPSNAPPGTFPINKDPRTKDHVEDIKPKLKEEGVYEPTDVFVTPERKMIVAGPGGKMIVIGDIGDYLHRDCPTYIPIPPGRGPTPPDGIQRPFFPPFIPDPITGGDPPVQLFPPIEGPSLEPVFEWPYLDFSDPPLDEGGRPLYPFGSGGGFGGSIGRPIGEPVGGRIGGRIGGGIRIPCLGGIF